MRRNQWGYRSPAVAAFLSFLWPGLGQWYAGRTRAAAIFAVPIAAMVLVLLAWIAGGVERAFIDLLVPSVALLFVLVVLVSGAWRIAAMVHAALAVDGRPGLRRPQVTGALIALTLVVVVTHVWAAAVARSLYNASNDVFVPPTAVDPAPSGSTPAPTDQFLATPGATPETASSRINILLTGIDTTEAEKHALTDTLIVVSVDPVTGDVAMVSFPRDIARFPEPDGSTFPSKINSLMTYANNHPAEYPDGGLPTLIKQLGFLLGVPIHYYAAVDLRGFANLIDAVGGVTVDNPKAISDPGYGGWRDGHRGFFLSKGKHHLDGETALAYARSRKGAGDSDFSRARRQQQLLLALRARLTDPSLLPQMPSIIEAGSKTLRTNFPQDRLAEMLTIGRTIEDEAGIRRVVLGPPYAKNPPAGTPGGYQLILDMDRLAKLSIDLFGDASSYAASR